MSIRLRLTLWYSTILAATLLIFGIAVYFISSYMMVSSQEEKLKLISKEIGPGRVYSVGSQTFIRLPQLDVIRYPGVFVQAVDGSGRVLGSSMDFSLPISFSEDFSKSRFTTEYIQGSRLLTYHVPVPVQGTNQAMLLQVGIIVDDIYEILRTLKLVLLGLSIITILLAATLGMFLSRKALKPIESVMAAAAQIEKGEDLGRRIEYVGPKDEIGKLTDTINSMLERIQKAYGELEDSNQAQRRFVSDASHELRTPLTTIRGNVDLLEKMWRQLPAGGGGDGQAATAPDEGRMEMTLEAMKDISGEAARMSRLVNDLLSLARADAGQVVNKEPLLLLPLVEEVGRKAVHLPRTSAWEVGDLTALEEVGIEGSRDYLQQLLFIFIENAFKYTPEGFVRMDALRDGEQVGIRISDTGIGMDKEEVPHIFERFYRADLSRGRTSGTGLGLSIAKWIIDEHQGSVEVMTRKGEGSTFIVWLPVVFHGTAD